MRHAADLLFHALVVEYACFQLNIDGEVCRLNQLENLLHRRNIRMLHLRMCFIEVKLTQLLQCIILHEARSIAGPVNGFIVAHHNCPIACQLNIQLYTIRAQLNRFLKSRQRILRHHAACTSVRPDQNLIRHISVPFSSQNSSKKISNTCN